MKTRTEKCISSDGLSQWPGQVSVMVGSIYALNALVGLDCSVHMGK